MHRLIPGFALMATLVTAAPTQADNVVLGPVQSTDTLWKLATQARPDEGVAMVQVVYALWQANPDAFSSQNINMLRAGAQLNVPQRSEMLATPVARARQWYYQAIAAKPGRLAKEPAPIAKENTIPTSMATVKTDAAVHQPAPATPVAAAATPTTPLHTAQPSKPATSKATMPETADESWLQQLSRDYTLTLQQRYYPQQGEQGQAKSHSSVAFSAEWVWQSEDRNHQLAFEPYLRFDQRDSERNLVDLRQAYWQYAGDGFDVKAGVDIVFWGVTESQHLVDVINQTDLVAHVDGETKLGQPMLNWNLYGAGGTLSMYLLPYFRERTLAGADGRLRPPLLVDTDQPLYESEQQENNLDFALRWSRQFDALDLALSYFEGNSREPILVPGQNNELQPLYLQMQQLGLEAQLISGSWIWKLESIYRKTRQQDFVAATAGFEYTQVGLFDSDWDLGWIAEYQYDSRDEQATLPGQNDIFVGTRFVANDAAGSEILLGLVQDLDNSDSRSGKIEASMRLSNNLRLRLDAWFFQSDTNWEPLYYIRHDDYLQLSLDYYF
mgnify:FL=1